MLVFQCAVKHFNDNHYISNPYPSELPCVFSVCRSLCSRKYRVCSGKGVLLYASEYDVSTCLPSVRNEKKSHGESKRDRARIKPSFFKKRKEKMNLLFQGLNLTMSHPAKMLHLPILPHPTYKGDSPV